MARITVEDCLETLNNRFLLVILATKRAKQLLSGARVTISEGSDNKSIVVGLREIAARSVRFMTEEEQIAFEKAEAERVAEMKKSSQQHTETNGSSSSNGTSHRAVI
jgi:DNA-directed RNA polymerase subunit omega